MSTVAKRASVSRPVSGRTLRHDFAVTAMRKGISLPSFQRLVGHDQLTTTQLYLNLSPEDMVGEYESKRWEAAQRGRSAINTKHRLQAPPTA